MNAEPRNTTDKSFAAALERFLGSLKTPGAALGLGVVGLILALAGFVNLTAMRIMLFLGFLLTTAHIFLRNSRPLQKATYVFITAIVIFGFERWAYNQGPFLHPGEDFPILVPMWTGTVWKIRVDRRGTRSLGQVDVTLTETSNLMLGLRHTLPAYPITPETPPYSSRTLPPGSGDRWIQTLTIPSLLPFSDTSIRPEFTVQPTLQGKTFIEGRIATGNGSSYYEYIKIEQRPGGIWLKAVRLVDTEHRLNLVNCIDRGVVWPPLWEVLGDEKPCGWKFPTSISPFTKKQSAYDWSKLDDKPGRKFNPY